MVRPRPTRSLEREMRRWGFVLAAGVDEVGRGCLAGPVVAAAVILDAARPVRGLRDSKLLTASARTRLDEAIRSRAVACAIASSEPDEIDRVNIHRASLTAMRRAVMALVPLPDIALVDGFRVPDLPLAQRAVVHGDATCSAIAAASIVAKVYRDRLMCALDEVDGRYGYARHKGYGTAEHLAAIQAFGLSSVHRRTFRQPTLFDAVAVQV